MRLACSTASFPSDRIEIALAKVAWAGFEHAELALHADPVPAEALLAEWDPLDLDALPAAPAYVYLNDAADGRVVPPGEGGLDLERLGAALEERGFEGSVCLRLQNADPW